AVEDRAVVVAVAYVLEEVGDAERGLVLVQLDDDVAHVGVQGHLRPGDFDRRGGGLRCRLRGRRVLRQGQRGQGEGGEHQQAGQHGGGSGVTGETGPGLVRKSAV